eukprot:3935474-Amphidinium_carterae.1
MASSKYKRRTTSELIKNDRQVRRSMLEGVAWGEERALHAHNSDQYGGFPTSICMCTSAAGLKFRARCQEDRSGHIL